MNFKEFKEKYEKISVSHYPNEVVENPIVSVCIQTYNHASYIEDCLESILKQRTNFPIEILLGEDDSNDNTREICLEYAQKAPDKIRLFLHNRENNIEIGGQPTGRFNFFYNLYSARGKYIALCEGDDYWTDSNKLQKQVEFMENNNTAVMVAHQALMVNHKGKSLYSFPKKQEKFLKPVKIILKGGGYFATSSILFKTDLITQKRPNWFYKFPAGDTSLYYLANEQGRIGFINKIWAAYRTNVPGSWTSKQSSDRKNRGKRLRRVLKCNNELLATSKYKFWFFLKQIETFKRIILNRIAF